MNRGTELGAVEPTHPQGFLQQQMEKGTIQRTFWRVERRHELNRGHGILESRSVRTKGFL